MKYKGHGVCIIKIVNDLNGIKGAVVYKKQGRSNPSNFHFYKFVAIKSGYCLLKSFFLSFSYGIPYLPVRPHWLISESRARIKNR